MEPRGSLYQTCTAALRATQWGRCKSPTEVDLPEAAQLDPELLRACSTTDVMRNFGAILANSAGTKETYALSVPVERIGVFLSHNWSMPRWQKFLMLAVHFNTRTAVSAMLLVCCPVAAFVATGMLPVVEGTYNDQLQSFSLWSLAIGTAVFLTTMLLGHELRVALQIPAQSCFLDKICIHQTCPVTKQQGIAGLAAFLCHSNEILVLHSPIYLRRLWTVYEIATVLILRPAMRITVIPVALPRLIVVANVHLLVFFIVLRVLANQWDMSAVYLASVQLLFVSVIYLSWVSVCWMWVKARAALEDDVRSFSISKAACAVESDREVVQQNVIAFMRVLGHVSADASDEETLNAFDDLSHEVLLAKLHTFFGTHGLPYHTTLLIGCCSLGLCMIDVVSGYILDSAEPRIILVWTLFYLVQLFCTLPLLLLLPCVGFDSGRGKGPLFNLGVCVGAWLAMCCVVRATIGIAQRAETDNEFLVVGAALTCLLIQNAGLAFRSDDGPVAPSLQERISPDPEERTSPDPEERTSTDPQERTSTDPQERTSTDPQERISPDPLCRRAS
eukprot:NODE_5293_length_1787_cov_4.944578.p1 GENE.NODE_5293_length_1787_cov_4.944578~~NODE_5293_length_1787_cov_4.944578.p1  ORF type:complete len:560 (+),score=27.01 NODE_5293_length_1787_cov_4.944578:105-1784(+)